jgi:hypothetical protein
MGDSRSESVRYKHYIGYEEMLSEYKVQTFLQLNFVFNCNKAIPVTGHEGQSTTLPCAPNSIRGYY